MIIRLRSTPCLIFAVGLAVTACENPEPSTAKPTPDSDAGPPPAGTAEPPASPDAGIPSDGETPETVPACDGALFTSDPPGRHITGGGAEGTESEGSEIPGPAVTYRASPILRDGNIAYLYNENHGLQVLLWDDPGRPRLLGETGTPWGDLRGFAQIGPHRVAVLLALEDLTRGEYDGGLPFPFDRAPITRLEIIDTTDLEHPAVRHRLDMYGEPAVAQFDGGTLYTVVFNHPSETALATGVTDPYNDPPLVTHYALDTNAAVIEPTVVLRYPGYLRRALISPPAMVSVTVDQEFPHGPQSGYALRASLGADPAGAVSPVLNLGLWQPRAMALTADGALLRLVGHPIDEHQWPQDRTELVFYDPITLAEVSRVDMGEPAHSLRLDGDTLIFTIADHDSQWCVVANAATPASAGVLAVKAVPETSGLELRGAAFRDGAAVLVFTGQVHDPHTVVAGLAPGGKPEVLALPGLAGTVSPLATDAREAGPVPFSGGGWIVPTKLYEGGYYFESRYHFIRMTGAKPGLASVVAGAPVPVALDVSAESSLIYDTETVAVLRHTNVAAPELGKAVEVTASEYPMGGLDGGRVTALHEPSRTSERPKEFRVLEPGMPREKPPVGAIATPWSWRHATWSAPRLVVWEPKMHPEPVVPEPTELGGPQPPPAPYPDLFAVYDFSDPERPRMTAVMPADPLKRDQPYTYGGAVFYARHNGGLASDVGVILRAITFDAHGAPVVAGESPGFAEHFGTGTQHGKWLFFSRRLEAENAAAHTVIFDLSNPATLTPVMVNVPGITVAGSADGRLLYTVSYDRQPGVTHTTLNIVGRDSACTRLRGQWTPGEYVENFVQDSGHVFALLHEMDAHQPQSWLAAVRVADPDAPVEVSRIEAGINARIIGASGPTVIVAHGASHKLATVFDFSDPAAPKAARRFVARETFSSAFIHEGQVYLGGRHLVREVPVP